MVRLALYDHPDGVSGGDAQQVTYDVDQGRAHFGPVDVEGHALVWRLEPAGTGDGALLAHDVRLDPDGDWIVRCDRVDFPPAAVAYTHTHPGPGIRYLLQGALEVRTEGRTAVYRPGEAWFESGPDPVHATAAPDGETAFVRVLLLPAEWEGRRTIRYVDPADEQRPKRQRPTVFFDRPLSLR
ncbi:MAG TPA: cupin domain-containing protein [Solirubrobacteraceae bacterium]|nr:cupin domain-containing protein [Solirubrobacteraceae bacterium]